MSGNPAVGTPCEMAIGEFQRTVANVRRFWNLIYAVSAASAAALVYAIVLTALGQGSWSLVSAAASVAGGAASAFLVKMKNGALRELTEAKRAVRLDCRGGAGERGVETRSAEVVDELMDRLLESY